MFEAGRIYKTTKFDAELFQSKTNGNRFIDVPPNTNLVYLGSTKTTSGIICFNWLYEGKLIYFYQFRTPTWYLEELFNLVKIK